MKAPIHSMGIAVSFILFLAATSPLQAQITTIYVEGEINENTTWSDDTVKVTGDVILGDDLTLTIEPGTYVEFQGYYSFDIYGTLKAIGTDNDSITFTIKDTTGFHIIDSPDGAWDAIIFNNTSLWGGYGEVMSDNDSTVIDHCVFKYAKYHIGNTKLDGGAIRIAGFSKMKIINSSFRNNLTHAWGGAICAFQDADILIQGNHFYKNRAKYGGALGIQACSPRIIDNYFGYNSTYPFHHDRNWGGGLLCNIGRAHIERNVFEYNKSNLGSGICLWTADARIIKNTISYNTGQFNESYGGGIHSDAQSNPLIVSNIISNNSAKYGGGIMSNNSDPVINSNLIANNYAETNAGGLGFNSSDAEVLNNTIINNQTDNAGGGIALAESSPTFINCILWGNTASEGQQYYQNDGFSLPDINFCNVESGLAGFEGWEFQGVYSNNISYDPVLIDPTTGSGIAQDARKYDFSLDPVSPCINKGKPDLSEIWMPSEDLAGNQRISHSYIDIGAYETYIPSIFVKDTIHNDTTWIADTVYIAGDVLVPDGSTLALTPGTRVQFQGHYKINVHGVLHAVGEQEDMIHFTVHDTTGISDIHSIEGGWKGIDFDNGFNGANGSMHDNDTSKLVYCLIEYGNTHDSTTENSGGAVYVHHFSRLLIQDCIIRNNYSVDRGGAIFLHYANPSIIRNDISFNHTPQGQGGGIYCIHSDPVIAHNTISNNESDGRGGGIMNNSSEPFIRNNIIYKNSSQQEGGGIFCLRSMARIVGNSILNNFAANGGAISIYTKPAEVSNNLIANNQTSSGGGGLYFYLVENILLINNTIVNNLSVDGGAMLGVLATFDCYNSILWNNQATNRGNQLFTMFANTGLNFYNSNIQGGIENFFTGSGGDWLPVFQDNLDTVPDFISALESAGWDFDAREGDWSLHPTSSCINVGTSNLPESNNLPATDLAGNSRIYGDLMDIGAYENPSGLPHLTHQPVNQILCSGESASFKVETVEKANYQWQKNEIDIPGANQEMYTIDSIGALDDGNYQCIVSNSHGNLKSNSSYLLVKTPANVLVEPSSGWIKEDESHTLSVTANGSMPFTYQWQKGEIDIEGATSPEYRINKADQLVEGEYTCVISNFCTTDTTTPSVIYVAPQICMVTVSPTTGHNLVIWEKKSKAPILFYNIYRESVAAGIYDLMESIPYDELSVFVDTVADPTVQAYLYKITAVDTGNVETDIDLCEPHKTIHLIVTTNPELKSTQLQWDRYYGFDYQTYTVYRSTTGMNFDPVHSMSASLNSWTDPDPSTGDLFYRIAVEKPDPCVPEGSGKKAGTGPYQHALSNMDDNKLKAGQLPPDTITLSNNWIHEDSRPGDVIGKLLTIDRDTLDSHTYKFISGDGSTDNSSFTIAGDLLMSSGSFDYQTKTQYNIRIRSTDEAGNYCEVSFIINIIPTGLNDIESGSVRVYPNPFSHSTTIRFPNPSNGSYDLILSDLSGKVYRVINDVRASEYELKRNGLRNGLYFLEIRGSETFRTKLVIE